MRRRPTWWTLGWDWQRAWGNHRLYWSLCLSEVNRPHVDMERHERGGYVALSWGNGNSDPVWSVSYEWGPK